jgi:C1A family cysteine protease
MVQRKYKCKVDTPDQRDHKFTLERLGVCATQTLPPVVDLRPYCSPVVDQLSLGCCTGCGITGAIEFLEIKDKKPFTPLSILYVYYLERWIEGTVDSDAGAEIRNGIKVLTKWGCCQDSLMPFCDDGYTFRIEPTPDAFADGSNHKAISYMRIQSLSNMKSCLYMGRPFIIGLSVYESFEKVNSYGIVPLPGINERLLGGHCMLCVGYDDIKKVFIIKNSWGTGFGDKGYIYVPYDYLSNCELASDMWCVFSEQGY